MKYIIRDIEKYTLENEHAILDSLRKADESIILHQSDIKLSELTVEAYSRDKEELFEFFCEGILALNKEETEKIEKEILVALLRSKKIYKDNNLTNIEKLYEKLKEIKFGILEPEIIENIKKIIMKVAFYSQTSFRKEFVDDRIIYTNGYYLDEEGIEKTGFTNIWYEPRTKEEMIYAMKEEVNYSGVIVNVHGEFDKFIYSFAKAETADNFDLYIFAKNNQELDSRTINIIDKYKMQLITILD